MGPETLRFEQVFELVALQRVAICVVKRRWARCVTLVTIG